MPSFRVHLLGGAAAFLAVYYYYYGAAVALAAAPAMLAAALLGAVLPDVDEAHTKQYRAVQASAAVAAFSLAFGAFRTMAERIAAGFGAAVVAVAFLRHVKPRHRGVTHRFVFAAAYAIVLFFLQGTAVAAAGFLGYASHILLDSVA